MMLTKNLFCLVLFCLDVEFIFTIIPLFDRTNLLGRQFTHDNVI